MHRILTKTSACALVLLALLVAASCSNDPGAVPSADAQAAPAGEKYPSLDLDGYKAMIADSSGKVLLVCLWSVNCPACQQELPVLEQLVDKFDADALRVVYASLDRDSQTIDDFFGDYEPIAEIVRVGEEVAVYTGADYIPRLVIYTPKGEVSFIDSGFYPEPMLEALLTRAGME